MENFGRPIRKKLWKTKILWVTLWETCAKLSGSMGYTMAAGPMEKAIRATLRELEVSPVTDARARLAVVLAVSLDAGAGMATAAISRELRATLSELENRDGGDTDGFADLLEQLSAPVVNPKN